MKCFKSNHLAILLCRRQNSSCKRKQYFKSLFKKLKEIKLAAANQSPCVNLIDNDQHHLATKRFPPLHFSTATNTSRPQEGGGTAKLLQPPHPQEGGGSALPLFSPA